MKSTDANNQITCLFPVGKAMTIDTALSFFLEVYNQFENKGSFMKNTPDTKRLREGYWGILAGDALDQLESKKHHICFPDDDSVDLIFVSDRQEKHPRPRVNALEFDVKEYTNHSAKSGFSSFIDSSVRPRFSSYGIIIGLHEDVANFDPSLLSHKDNERGVLLVSAPGAGSNEILKGKVEYFHALDEPIPIDIDLRDRDTSVENREVFANELIKRPAI